MKNAIKAAMAVFGALAIMQTAWAAPMPVTQTWNFSSGGTAVSGGSGFGNTMTFSLGGHTAKVKAFSSDSNDGSGVFRAAEVKQYSGGLGARNAYDAQDINDSAPEHAVDNYGKDDFLLFEFDTLVDFSQFQLGWTAPTDGISTYQGSSTRSDVQFFVGPNNGTTLNTGTWANNVCISGCSSLLSSFSALDLKQNVSKNTLTNVYGGSAGDIADHRDSRYLLVSGALGTLGASSFEGKDFWKFSGLTTKLPEPASFMLVALGLAGFSLRRKPESR